MRIPKTLIATAAIVALASAAMTQPPQGGRRGGGGGFGGMGGNIRGGGMVLATNPSVQEELKLTDAQKDKLKEAQKTQGEKMRELFGKLRDAEEGDREKLAAEMRSL